METLNWLIFLNFQSFLFKFHLIVRILYLKKKQNIKIIMDLLFVIYILIIYNIFKLFNLLNQYVTLIDIEANKNVNFI